MKKILSPIIWVLLWPALAQAGSLRVNYAEVVVENFQPGVSYNLTQAANYPLELLNKYDVPVTVAIGPAKPEKYQLKKGFEPIPDTKWIDLGKTPVDIDPKQTYRTDVKILIPDDSKYLGKKYQVNIMSTIIGSRGVKPIISMTTIGKLLFTVAPVKQAVDLSKTDVNLNFNLLPDRLELKKFPLGYKVEITKNQKPIEVENGDSKTKIIHLESIDPKQTVVTDDVYKPAFQPELVTFDTPEFSLDGNAKKALRIFVELPDKPEYREKQIYFIVAVSTGKGDAVQGKRYLRILVDTSTKEEEPVKAPAKNSKAAAKDDKAAAKDDKAAAKDDKAAAKDDKAAAKDDKAAAKDDKAAVKDDKAAAKDDKAAVKDDKAAAKDDKAAVKDDKAAVKDDKAAVKDAADATSDDSDEQKNVTKSGDSTSNTETKVDSK